MKILYCKKCKDLFKLTRDEVRKCKCKGSKVHGRYLKDGHEAKTSENKATISIAIDNHSLKAAIKRMRWWKEHRHESTREDYKTFSSLVAYVRPNSGRGNPNSNRTKPKLKKT
jgi:hypothetical protein